MTTEKTSIEKFVESFLEYIIGFDIESANSLEKDRFHKSCEALIKCSERVKISEEFFSKLIELLLSRKLSRPNTFELKLADMLRKYASSLVGTAIKYIRNADTVENKLLLLNLISRALRHIDLPFLLEEYDSVDDVWYKIRITHIVGEIMSVPEPSSVSLHGATCTCNQVLDSFTRGTHRCQ